jgi:hypothetical protein
MKPAFSILALPTLLAAARDRPDIAAAALPMGLRIEAAPLP